MPENFKRVECPEPVEGLAFIYILYCNNGSFYVGHTNNISQRLERHRNGSGARHTRQLKGCELVYTEGAMSTESAIKKERQLKKWSRSKKIALIKGNLDKLRELSKSRD